MINSRKAFTCLLIMIAVSSVVGAQTITQSFDDLQRILKVNQQIVVTDETGEKTKGRVASVSDSSLTLHVKATKRNPQGTRTFTDNTVATIAPVDSVADGTLIGLGAGVAAAWGFLRSNCGAEGFSTECGGIAGPIGTLIFVPAGAVAGTLIDRAMGNRPFYVSRGTRFLTVSPWMGARSGGLAISLGF
jgi:hypothetical protein